MTGRDESGRFLPGVSGNPGGRPKGQSLTARLRERLQQAAADGEGEVADRLVDSLIEAAAGGDNRAMKRLWSYAEGLPTATLLVDAEPWEVPILTPEEIEEKDRNEPGWQRGPIIIDDI